MGGVNGELLYLWVYLKRRCTRRKRGQDTYRRQDKKPAPKAKDKKQLKEEKRRKKLDKLKKIRRTGLTSGDGNDIDLYPED